MRAQSMGQEDPLEEEMETHSSILAWEIQWTEEPGGQQQHLRPSMAWGCDSSRPGFESRCPCDLGQGTYLSKSPLFFCKVR